MNNAMEQALIRINSTIPKEIIQYAFQARDPWERSLTVEQLIIKRVIHYRVLANINVFGGKATEIVLQPEYLESIQMTKDDAVSRTGPFSLYRIPPEVRENSPIVEVHSLNYSGNYSSFMPNQVWRGASSAPAAAEAVLDSHTFASSPPKPQVQLLSGDLVKLTPSQHATVCWVMYCRIAYDPEFTNLNTSALETFSKVCEHAVKAYIYNEKVIEINRAFLEHGVDLGVFKEIIDRYAESEERYNELISEMNGAVILDPARMGNLLQYML